MGAVPIPTLIPPMPQGDIDIYSPSHSLRKQPASMPQRVPLPHDTLQFHSNQSPPIPPYFQYRGMPASMPTGGASDTPINPYLLAGHYIKQVRLLLLLTCLLLFTCFVCLLVVCCCLLFYLFTCLFVVVYLFTCCFCCCLRAVVYMFICCCLRVYVLLLFTCCCCCLRVYVLLFSREQTRTRKCASGSSTPAPKF